jgi:hypothetical protein
VNGNALGRNPTPPGFLINGTYIQTPDATLQAIAQEARNFSAAAAAEGATLGSFANIGAIGNTTGSYTLTSANQTEPGTFIVNATSLSLSSGNAFTLNGSLLPQGARVILNVANSFSLSGGSKVNLIGLDPSHVLINFRGTSSAITSGTTPGTAILATFLAPNAQASFNATGGFVAGSIIANTVNLSNGLTVEGLAFIPEPGTYLAAALMLVPLGVGTLRAVRKKSS